MLTTDELRRSFRYTRVSDDTAGVLRSKRKRNATRRDRKRAKLQKLRQREKARRDPSVPWEIVYGLVEIGGVITFIHTSGSAKDKNKNLHMIVTLCAHEIQAIDAVFIDEYQVEWERNPANRPTKAATGSGYFQSPRIDAAGKFRSVFSMQINYGWAGSLALSAPSNDDSDSYEPVSSKWTADHRQRGHTHVYLRMVWNEKIFKGGVPDIVFRVRGMRKVTDPRTNEDVPGSTNPALILYDYVTNPWFGMNIPADRIDIESFRAAADICDEPVELADGTFQKRYEINTHFSLDQSPLTTLREMTAAMAGRLCYVEGKLKVLAGKGRTPVLDITEDMIVGDLTIETATPREDSFNVVKGSFVSAEKFFTEDDFTPVENAAYLEEDSGVEVREDAQFDMTTSEVGCQRLAKILLESNRQGITVELVATMAAYRAEPGEWITLTLLRYGWDAKPFEVARSSLRVSSDDNGAPVFGVELTLRETAAAVYEWNKGEETTDDPSEDTNLPDPFSVLPPKDLALASGTDHLYIRSDGTIFSRLRVSWTEPEDTFVINGGHYEIQYRRGDENTVDVGVSWQQAPSVAGGGDYAYILDVQDGSPYDVRVRAVNSAGRKSDWAQANGHVVVGKTAPPSNVPMLAARVEGASVRLEWSRVTDLDVREYEIRAGTTAQSWGDMAATAVRLQATSYLLKNPVSGDMRFLVKAVDTSGNESPAAASADILLVSPPAVDGLSARQVDNNILVDWTEPAQGTFPVEKYRAYKGNAFAGATLLGEVRGTFFTWFETESGQFTYWVTAVDSAGNEGPATSKTLSVLNPPDYVIIDRRTLTPADATLSLAVAEGGDILLPVDPAQTWQQHFTGAGKTTIQGFLDAGYSSFLMPGAPGPGSATWTYDLGQLIARNTITLNVARSSLEGAPRVSATISHRATTSDPWTETTFGGAVPLPDSVQVRAVNFRFVRIQVSADQGAGTGIARLSFVEARIETKKQTDSGTAVASAADASGTVIYFSRAFLDVLSINATPQGNASRVVVVDFADIPNPVSFRVLLFDADGNRVTGSVSWIAEGIVNNE
jgi:hypothetical protein